MPQTAPLHVLLRKVRAHLPLGLLARDSAFSAAQPNRPLVTACSFHPFLVQEYVVQSIATPFLPVFGATAGASAAIPDLADARESRMSCSGMHKLTLSMRKACP